jgi:hypothetical protein
MENIRLNKTVFDKANYTKIVDTQFTELIPQQKQPIIATELPSIDQFFNFYNQLFYVIAKTGDTNSHTYLIQQSSNYVGDTQTNEDIQALLDEIDELRVENLSLNQQIVQLQSQTTKEQAKRALDAATS